MNNPQLDQAREWADDSSYQGDALSVAAARVIQALPDQWIDAEKVRELIDTYKHARDGNAAGTEGWVTNHLVVRNLESLLTPPLPTLADMDEDARHALIGKDVNVEGWNNPSMLIAVHKNEGAVLGHNWINPWPFVEVRPLSELTPVDTAPDQQVNSSESPKSSLPRPEDVPAGEPWIVESEGVEWVGCRNEPGARLPWLVICVNDHNFDYCYDSDITLITRLVPEDKP